MGKRHRRIAQRQKAAPPRTAMTVDADRGWVHLFSTGQDESNFQRDIHLPRDMVLANWAVFACMTQIAGDIGKMRARLMQRDAKGIWEETDSASFSPVLRKPNEYQIWQKYVESWQLSKLSRGNAYSLKERDDRNVVTALHVLHPDRCRPLVAPDGEVWYELSEDWLAQVPDGERVMVPASEIIHDRAWCLFHPLCGLSPIFACGLTAAQAQGIQAYSSTFFANMSRPSGALVAPGFLTDEQARVYKKRWEETYGAGKQGRTAILGSGLKYEPITMSADDSQLIEQLKFTADIVCSVFHVPGFKVGVGAMPPFQSAELLNQIYYDDCLQTLIESIESLLDEALGLTKKVEGKTYRVELDIDALLRMDEKALTSVLKEQVGAGITSPNEARFRLNRKPVKGGESPMAQQQNFSLAALAKRDASEDPFATAKPAPAAAPAPPPPPAPAPAKLIEAIEKDISERLLFAAKLEQTIQAAEERDVQRRADDEARRVGAEAKEAERRRAADEVARLDEQRRALETAQAEQRATQARLEAETERLARAAEERVRVEAAEAEVRRQAEAARVEAERLAEERRLREAEQTRLAAETSRRHAEELALAERAATEAFMRDLQTGIELLEPVRG